jgi:hypothetical protein
MKTKDLLTIATVALGTTTLTVATFWAGPIDAGNDADTPSPKLARPLLISHGVELALAAAGGRTFKAGDQPEFALTATNTTNQLATVNVCVTLTASAPANPLSRVIRLPSELWRQDQVVSLRPNETRVYALCAKTNLPPASVISVSLQDLELQPPRPLAPTVAQVMQTNSPIQAPALRPPPGIVALTVSTTAVAPQPVVASTR